MGIAAGSADWWGTALPRVSGVMDQPYRGAMIIVPPDATPTNGDDVLIGTDGRDRIFALGGDDAVVGTRGADRLDGGPGEDLLTYELSSSRIILDLERPQISLGDARGDIVTNFEVIKATRFADQLRGSDADEGFFAGDFSDRLYGRGGDDSMIGGRGVDALYGNQGRDIMFGGEGDGSVDPQRDRFIYFQYADSGVGAANADLIADFVSGTDRIEISRLDGDVTTGGKQALTFIGAAPFSGSAGEVRYRDAGSSVAVQIDNDGDADADFEIFLAGVDGLVAGDFLL